jgi:hypothetical protein
VSPHGRLLYRIYESPIKRHTGRGSDKAHGGTDSGGENTMWVNNDNYRVEKAEFSLERRAGEPITNI